MRLLPQRIFSRLVFGLVIVSTVAIGTGAYYLYSRFHDVHSPFHEGTLQLFAKEILKGISVRDGKVVATIGNDLVNEITADDGAFVITDAAGNTVYATPGQRKPFVPVDDGRYRYFVLNGKTGQPDLYGLSAPVPGVNARLQIVFPAGTTIVESLLHEFMKDIAWLWTPFLAAVLVVNILLVRMVLRPLHRAVEEARGIGPIGSNRSLSEDGVPEDLLPLVKTVNGAFSRLREAYAEQELFVADMAHELRTPLSVMKLQLAEMASPAARLLERDVSDMVRLVEQLLDRARLGRHHATPPEPLVLQEVAREAAVYLAPEIVRQGRRVEVAAGEAPVICLGWRDDVFRAVRNLVENALWHSPPGGMISIEVGAERTVTVRDQGPGFPADLLDPASRAKRVLRSDRRGGVGLGLSIVDKTMQAHGGELTLGNNEHGAAAALRFPATLVLSG